MHTNTFPELLIDSIEQLQRRSMSDQLLHSPKEDLEQEPAVEDDICSPVLTSSPSDTSQLPDGWSRKIVQRQSGKSAGKYDTYIYSPDGKKFRSRQEIQRHLEKIGSELKVEQFDFRIQGREHVAIKAKRRECDKILDEASGSGGDTISEIPVPDAKKKKKHKMGKNRSKETSSAKGSSGRNRLIVKMNFGKKKAKTIELSPLPSRSLENYLEQSLPVKKRRKDASKLSKSKRSNGQRNVTLTE